MKSSAPPQGSIARHYNTAGDSVALTHVRHLGTGGFGTVDLVQESTNALQYARKTFVPPPNLDARMLENVKKRFAREVRTQSGMRHRNIVPILHSELLAAPPYYLMPVAMGTLADDIGRDRTLGGGWLQAISDIVAALDEMHAINIFHRDLKPQNVLKYQEAGQPAYYAVSDFGLIAMDESRVTALTTTGMYKGTDYYTAPEITSDLRRASAQSDIYSLGCILHEFVGSGPRVPCHEIKEAGPYSGVLLSCTRTDPARRFRSVRDVLDAIVGIAMTAVGTPPATANATFIDQFNARAAMDEVTWRSLVEYVEDHEGAQYTNSILAALSLQQAQQLCATFPELGNRLGQCYANWVRGAFLRFDYCDYVANIIEQFFSTGTFETRVESLMALLRMGTSHNRWYVEKKFATLAGPSMDESLARRLAVEIRATGADVCGMIDHLEASISITRQSLHPVIVQTLAEVCR